MNKRTYLLALALAASFLLSTPASAGVLYNNGPINGTSDGWNISAGYQVADSFTLAGTSTLTGVDQIGLWVTAGANPVSLVWGISASNLFGNELGGGTASLTNSVFCTASITCGGGLSYDVYSSSFSLTPNIVLGPGTYWLTFQSGVSSLGSNVFWDTNNGPSVAVENVAGNIASESFRILGDSSAAPEPASTAMFLSGLVLVAGLARRKMRA